MQSKPQLYFEKDSYIILGKNKYKVINVLGSGQNGQVYKCISAKGGENENPIAIKVIQKETFKLNPGDEKFLQREVEILKEIQNPNILKYIDFQEDFKYFYLITELCEHGNLAELLQQQGTVIEHDYYELYAFSEKQALSILSQLLYAFQSLQTQSIIHRDLKLENILVSGGIVKLGDFGFSRILRDGTLAQTCCGSPKTMAPEISLNQSYGAQVDVYSLGIVLYQMLFGCFPYSQSTGQENAILCKNNEMDLEKFGIQISEQTKELLQVMIKFDPKERITFEQLFVKFSIESELYEKVINSKEVQYIKNKLQSKDSQQQQVQQQQQSKQQQQQISQQEEILKRDQINTSFQQESLLKQKRQTVGDRYQQSFQEMADITQFNQSLINYSENAIPLEIGLVGENTVIKNLIIEYYQEFENRIINLKNNTKFEVLLQDCDLSNLKQKLECKGFLLVVDAEQQNASEVLKQYISKIYDKHGNNPYTKKRIFILVNMNEQINKKNYDEIFQICNKNQIEGELKDIQVNQQGISNVIMKLVKKLQKVQSQQQREAREFCCSPVF